MGSIIQFVGSSLEWLYQLTGKLGYLVVLWQLYTNHSKIILYPLTHNQMNR